MGWEQEAGDDLPLIYHYLSENRRVLEAHEAEQDRIEAKAGRLVGGVSSVRPALWADADSSTLRPR